MGTERRSCVCCSLVCAVCRIACFTCVRKSCPCCVNPPPQARTGLSILCLGLQGAGKTTLLATVAGEPTDNIEPTMGFVIKTVNVQQHPLTLNFQELGGSEQIRLYWNQYYTNRDLLMYVVDSSCSEQELAESHSVLTQCLSSPSLSHVPLLLVCSKHDISSATPTSETEEKLKVGEIAQKRNVLVVSTSSSQQPQATRETIIQALVQLYTGDRTH